MPPNRRRRTACGTCVRRKVKCDETHPVCSRCKKGNFVCEGYESKIMFVEENPASNMALGHPVFLEPDSPESSASLESSSSPSPSLDLSAWQANIAVAFTMENLFRQQQHGLYQDEHPARSWLEVAIGNGSSEINMDGAIGALCIAYFGKRHHQLNLVRQANIRYGRALVSLNQSLSDPEAVRSLETLKDTMALVVYEAIVFTEPRNWMLHADGMARLFQVRGPESFQDPLSVQIFLSCRMIIILQCLVLRKQCFLAEPVWQALPSLLTPETRSLLMEVQDIMCFVPGMLQELSALKNLPLSQDELSVRSHDILQYINTALSSLFQWRWKWHVKNPRSVRSVPIEATKAVPFTPFDSVLFFDCLENANCIVIYGGAFITLYEMAEGLVGRGNFSLTAALEDARHHGAAILPDRAGGVSLLSMPHEQMNPEGMALELCTMADYHFEEGHRGMGVFILLWPLKLAEHVLAGRVVISQWINAMLDRIAGEDALEAVRFPTLPMD